ncbi:LysR family transcriptional regulator [Enterococcus hulanensis]|uniref:LysR family transcriptional regulator n=1 Tax=Enterococcus hulanensis TaxID=2559929 RepID=UPI001A8ECAE0|nr:LysR family transcriptional regulator [Enterococcus hulanensis]MBO0456508.1 LysR family transcriptional regulator [Enterococcus hulanensis]
MNIKQIESFILLSSELHYGKAAERLGISQPSLSQQMKGLEKDLGVSLFEKNGRNIKLTKAGRVFLKRSLMIQHEVIGAEKEMRYFKSNLREGIRLGVSGSHLIMNAFQKFTEAYPDTVMYITENSTKQTIEKVADRQIELGIVYEYEQSCELVVEPLFYDELLAVIPNNHELADKSKILLKDLNNEPLILLEQRFIIRKFIDKELKRKNIVPNIICELNNYYASIAYIEKQLGISLIAKSMLQEANIPSSVSVRPIEDLIFHKRVDLVYRKDLLIDEPIAYLFQKIRLMKVMGMEEYFD